MIGSTRRFWGWGTEADALSPSQVSDLGAMLATLFNLDDVDPVAPPTVEELHLPEPRLSPPAVLAPMCTTDPGERAGHTYGKSFRDVVRALRRDFAHPPDLVALPRSESDVVALLDWCSDTGAAAIPYGGGSSVVGGVECDVGDAYRGVVSIDLRHLDRVLEVDRPSRAARIQAGTYGPALEDQLRPHGLTLRHFPQSFEHSTLGGWLATRAGGHFATLYTHIDDLTESLRMVTPRGVLESRRLPGSGAGPSPDRLLLGSEGTLGVITEAWMRVQDRPRHRASATATFTDYGTAVDATRALAQSGLHPSNCRLIDATEALIMGVGDGSAHVLLVAFESADHPLDAWIARAVECTRDHGGTVDGASGRTGTEDGSDVGSSSGREGMSASWRTAFIRAPYTRDALVQMGMLNETFETAITWDRFESLHRTVTTATRDALRAVGAGDGVVTCRFTHVYPDGPAPYFTVVAPGRRDGMLEQWAAVKAAASAAIVEHGGTITHHHAVGRDHRPWYDRQRPPLFAEALRAVKRTLDPASILNPGVLVDP
ncbi:MAG: FAD-binding oxidoreductase [Acidimicrobiia bacterium]